MMGRLLYVLCKLFSNCSILLLERICIGISCYPILLIYQSNIWNEKKEVIRIRKSTKDRQHSGQQKRDKRTNIYLQNITQRTKDRAIRAPLKTGNELGCSGRVSSSILYLVFLMHIIIRFHFHCLLRMLSFLSPVQNLFMDSFTV